MSQYRSPGGFMMEYVREAVPNTLLFAIMFLPVAGWIPLFISASSLAILGWAAYFGVVFYMSSLHRVGETSTISELEEPRSVKIVASIMVLLYYNTIVMLSIISAVILYAADFTVLAIPAAILVPFIDGEATRRSYPSFGIAFMILPAIVSWIVRRLPGGVSEVADILSTVTDNLEASGGIQAESIRRVEAMKRVWF